MIRVLANLAGVRRWTSWRNEPRAADDKLTKVPYSALGHRAQSNNPKTWLTRLAAEALAPAIINPALGGGIGVWLGELGDGTVLIGADLDTCRDPATGVIERWALEVIERLNSYTELSPSHTGAKIFALCSTPALAEVREVTGIKHGRSFARRNGVAEHPPAIELHVGNRYFAVTDEHLEGTPHELASLAPDALIWLLRDRGPTFASAGPENPGPGSDNSRSGIVFRIALRMRREGKIFEQFCEAVRTDPATSAWFHEKGVLLNHRQLQRAWECASTNGKFDLTAAQAALESEPAAGVVNLFLRLILGGDPDPIELEQLLKIAARRADISRRAIKAKLKLASAKAKSPTGQSRFEIEDGCMTYVKTTNTGYVP